MFDDHVTLLLMDMTHPKQTGIIAKTNGNFPFVLLNGFRRVQQIVFIEQERQWLPLYGFANANSI